MFTQCDPQILVEYIAYIPLQREIKCIGPSRWFKPPTRPFRSTRYKPHVDFMLFVSISFTLGTQCEPVFGGIWAYS